MNRRDAVLGLLALGCIPHLASAQQKGKVWRIGYLSPLTPSTDGTRRDGFRQGLRELQYVEGRNILIEYRFADGKLDRLPALAAELVALNVDIIIAAGGGLIARVAQGATKTIPIVMTNVEDPVASGLVASLSKPGGNVTGLSALIPELSAKRLELLRNMVPTLSRAGVLWNSSYPEKETEFKQTQAAGKVLGIRIESLEIRDPKGIDVTFELAIKARVGALITLPDPVTNTMQARIVEFAASRLLPTMFTQRPPVDLGGLMSYGPSYTDLFRRSAMYVDKIVRGAMPRDLPVEQPAKFELVVNLKTAKALGLNVPQSILALADAVVQ